MSVLSKYSFQHVYVLLVISEFERGGQVLHHYPRCGITEMLQ